MTTEALFILKGKNELGRAVASAERDLKRLVRQGDVLGKLFRGGAILAAVRSFEALAKNAQAASEAIGDKGTAGALKLLNTEIDRLKNKGLNLIGKVLLGGKTETDLLEKRIRGLRQLIGIKDLIGADTGSLTQQLNRSLAQLDALTDRPGRAGPSRGGVARQREFYEKLHKGDKPDFSFLQEIVITAQRAELSGLAAVHAEMERDTRTTVQNQIAEWELLERQIDELAGAGVIGGSDAAERRAEATDEFLKPLELQFSRFERIAVQKTKVVSEFWLQAMRNMQDALAGFLAESSGNFKDFGREALNVIRQILAQLAAAEIFDFFRGLGGNVIPGKAAGGPVSAGSPYVVGERGPELFVPTSSGTIIPNGGGGVVINQTINMDNRGATTDLIKVLPAILEQNKRETVALAQEKIRNNVRRYGRI